MRGEQQLNTPSQGNTSWGWTPLLEKTRKDNLFISQQPYPHWAKYDFFFFFGVGRNTRITPTFKVPFFTISKNLFQLHIIRNSNRGRSRYWVVISQWREVNIYIIFCMQIAFFYLLFIYIDSSRLGDLNLKSRMSLLKILESVNQLNYKIFD